MVFICFLMFYSVFFVLCVLSFFCFFLLFLFSFLLFLIFFFLVITLPESGPRPHMRVVALLTNVQRMWDFDHSTERALYQLLLKARAANISTLSTSFTFDSFFLFSFF